MSETTPTMRYRILDSFAVVVHSSKPPTDTEWNTWVDSYVQEALPRGLPLCVITSGGAPNAVQRDRLIDALAHDKPRVAIITKNRITRSVVSAFQWFGGKHIKAFAPARVDLALEHLALPPATKPELERIAGELAAEVGDDACR